jgi:uncharacterized protein (DUF2147 family)
LGPDYTDELDDDFTVHELNKFILSRKNNKATGCDGIPAEAWKMLVTNDEGNEILVKLFNMTRSKTQFPKEWKTALIQLIYKVKGNQRVPGNYSGISLLPVLGKTYSGIIAHRLRNS